MVSRIAVTVAERGTRRIFVVPGLLASTRTGRASVALLRPVAAPARAGGIMVIHPGSRSGGRSCVGRVFCFLSLPSASPKKKLFLGRCLL